jgi:hypothetical protein
LVQVDKVVLKLKQGVQEKEEERDRIISDYQKALREYETTAPELRESQLIKLKKKLEINRDQILDTRKNFIEIEQNCKVIKRRLAANVKDVDRVEECLSKREYLKKLRKATEKYIEPERSLSNLLESKRKLVDAVAAFGR